MIGAGIATPASQARFSTAYAISMLVLKSGRSALTVMRLIAKTPPVVGTRHNSFDRPPLTRTGSALSRPSPNRRTTISIAYSYRPEG
ncbi:hypothetical protein [Actinoplanes sp. NPDC026619]|uniref:hypothetical protein n=1 Tax=Actinoplanes sp. NPDC026619 TaxID=3155798 RepID=UPI0033E2A6E5